MRTTWKRRSQLCEADQLTATNVPDGVEEVRIGITTKTGYAMQSAFGLVMLPLGTWIIYDEEGARPVRKEDFERLYVPLRMSGRLVALGRRAAQKIITKG